MENKIFNSYDASKSVECYLNCHTKDLKKIQTLKNVNEEISNVNKLEKRYNYYISAKESKSCDTDSFFCVVSV